MVLLSYSTLQEIFRIRGHGQSSLSKLMSLIFPTEVIIIPGKNIIS